MCLEGNVVFYEKFVRMCVQKGVSPTAVAKAIGVNPSTVSDWSRGAKPRAHTLIRLAEYFGVDVTEFTINADTSLPDGAIPVRIITREDTLILAYYNSLPQDAKNYVRTMLEALSSHYGESK